MYNSINMVLAISDSAKVAFTVLLVIVAIVVLILFLLFLKFFRLWLQAKLSCADVKFPELIGMWLRKVDTRTIVLSKITAIQVGLTLQRGIWKAII